MKPTLPASFLFIVTVVLSAHARADIPRLEDSLAV